MNISKSLILILLYSSIFLIIGISTVYLPTWLNKELQIDLRIISLVLGFAALVKSFFNIMLIRYIKEPRYLKNVLLSIVVIMIFNYSSIILFLYLNKNTLIIYLVIFSIILFAPSMPIVENINNNINDNYNVNYGKIRLAGSLSFLLSVFIFSFLIDNFSIILFPYLFLLFIFIFFIIIILIPKEDTNKTVNFSISICSFFKNKSLLLVVLFCSLIQASHSMYYTFSTIVWNNNGIRISQIGYLWTCAILFEIFLFFFINKFNIKYHIVKLFYLCSILSLIRWTLTPLTFDFHSLIILQSFHAISFGLTHYLMMYYIYNLVSKNLRLMAQIFYFSFTGIFITLLTIVSGQIFFYLSSSLSYWLMSLICAFSIVLLIVAKIKNYKS